MRRLLVTAIIAALAATASGPLAFAKNSEAPGQLKKTETSPQPPGQADKNVPPGQAKHEENPPPGQIKQLDVGGGEPGGPSVVFTPCAMADIGLSSGSCSGWTEGNFNSGNAGDKAFSAGVLNSLLGVNTYTGPTLVWLENFDVSGGSVNFSHLLTGLTVVSFHVGGAGGDPTGVGYESTAWYVFDAGSTGIDVLTFNKGGLSNARLYSTGGVVAVPEPGAWALMITGFAGIGALLRRRRAAFA